MPGNGPRSSTTRAVRSELSDVFVDGARRSSAFRRRRSEEIAFELLVDSCLLTRTTGHGDPSPVTRSGVTST